MNNLEIREAITEDIFHGLLNAFIDGYRFHQNGRPDIFSNMTDEELRFKLVKDMDKLKMLVAVKEDEVVGYIAYEILEKNNKRKLYIDQLAVRKEFRKQGFGKALIDELVKKGKELDCMRIEFNCWLFNENAMKLYDDLGFQRQRIIYEMKL